jgi:membrane protease YdiL (CAAX protease family)
MSYTSIKPFIYSIIALFLVFGLNKLSLDFIFNGYNFDSYSTLAIGKIIKNIISIILIIFLLRYIKVIPFFNFSLKINKIYFYIPLLIYVFVFSGGFKIFREFNFSDTTINIFVTYLLRVLSSAFLEEYLFRGLILGIFLFYYPKTKKGLLKSVIFSSLIFGIMHIVNLWTIEEETSENVINQIYAASCIGIMYGATYLRTKSIVILGILHFLTNFFTLIKEISLSSNEPYEKVIQQDDLVSLIVSQFLTLIIYGIPLFIGLYLILKMPKKDIESLKMNT